MDTAFLSSPNIHFEANMTDEDSYYGRSSDLNLT